MALAKLNWSTTHGIDLIYPAWWRHQMEIFSALLAICAGNSPVPGDFPHKGQLRGALMFSLICVWINGWVNPYFPLPKRRRRWQYEKTLLPRWISCSVMKSLFCQETPAYIAIIITACIQWVGTLNELKRRFSPTIVKGQWVNNYNAMETISNYICHYLSWIMLVKVASESACDGRTMGQIIVGFPSSTVCR